VKQTICKQISPAQAAQISWACHMQGRPKKKGKNSLEEVKGEERGRGEE
jgi:hypothetical protein